MSHGELHALAGLLAAAGLVLAVLTGVGFDQRPVTRFVDGVAGAGYLGGAAYLLIAQPSLPIYWFATAAPVLLLLIQLLRDRVRARRRRLAAGLTKMYVTPPANTPLTPFPEPPPPLDPSAKKEQPAEPVAPRAYRPMPSGLPPRGEAAPAPHAEPAQPPPPPETPGHAEPAGPPSRGEAQPAAHAERTGPPSHGAAAPAAHAEPAGHDTAGVQETTSRLRRPAYLSDPDPPDNSGRHRAADPDR